jgi:hypothetical protein
MRSGEKLIMSFKPYGWEKGEGFSFWKIGRIGVG